MGRRRVLVTGAASGMGAETAALLTSRGDDVVAVDVSEAGLQRLHAAGHAASTHVVDLSDPGAVATMLEAVEVDAVANVAGLGPDAEDPRLILAVNLVAPLSIVASLVDRLPEGAPVVNVASVTGELADTPPDDLDLDPLGPGFLDLVVPELADGAAAYTYSKWALLRRTDALAVDLSPRVRVNAVSPGIVDTPMGNRSMQYAWTVKAAERIPQQRLGRATEVAHAIAFLLSDDAAYVTASRLVVDGGYVAATKARRSMR